MTNFTDPARELVDICQLVSSGSSEAGYAVLSRAFDVNHGSSDFFQIIFSIQDRIDELIGMIDSLQMDIDYKEEAKQNLESVRLAFSIEALPQSWGNISKAYISQTQLGPVKMLSSMVRDKYAYPKLTEVDRLELLGEVTLFLEWLQEHQLNEHDFVRAALIKGTQQFRFRLERLQWFGWGFTVASLREVISAYMVLEGAAPEPGIDPMPRAILVKSKAFLVSCHEKVTGLKDIIDNADFVLRVYGTAVALTSKSIGVPAIIEKLTG